MAFNQKIAEDIGNRLRLSRQKAGYQTLVSFTAKYNITRSTYNQYEIGDRLLCVQNAILFCKIFKTNLIWLLTGNGNPDITDSEMLALTENATTTNSLTEKDFLSIINDSKKNQNKIKDKSIYLQSQNSAFDLMLLQDILEKVYSMLELFDSKVNHKDLAYLTCCIYADVKNLKHNKSDLEILEIITKTLKKYLSKNQKISNF